MGLNAAVQALKKAEPLKDKIQRCKDLLNDNDAWVCQQQLQKIYQQVLILDLEYALDKKVEQELWNLGFKNCIALLQNQAKDRKNPKRSESQAMLSWYLEAASGFYLTLLQEICTAFDLDLPFRRKGYIYGCISPWKAVEKLSTPHKSSCFYACQYCLVHLGDIARYRNQNRQAELFYRHAVSLSPSSGQPYNQLALLEASRGDKLGTVFHYVRSVAVKHPFPVATSNLAKILSSALNDNLSTIHEKPKLNSQEYIIIFLKLHGILHNLGDLNLAKSYVKSLSGTLTALVATESFNSWRLIQMLVINLYSLHHTAGNSFESSIDLMKVDQLSSDERIARNCVLDLIAAGLSALLLPVYTVKNSYVEYFALPTIKLVLEWIRQQPMILEDPAFSSRLQIWPSLCVLLNGLQSSVVDFKTENFTKTPLPEDRDLQGFLPLEKTFESLRFYSNDLEGDVVSINKLRAVRIISLGKHLAQCHVNGRTLLNVVSTENDQVQFTCVSDVSGPSNELMKELEELSLNKEKQVLFTASPVPSESASSKGSSEAEIAEQLSFEKKVGILKPSLERIKDPIPQVHQINPEISSVTSTRKTRQNIAMQAIMRRVENEQKQVTFKNVSPMIVEDGMDAKKKQKEVEYTPISVQPSANGISAAQALITSQLIEDPQKPLNPEIHGPQKAPRSRFPSPIYSDQAINVQDRPFDKPFGVNIMPPIPQFPRHQVDLPTIPQNIQQLPPKPSPSSLPHPMMMNPQGVADQKLPFFEKNSPIHPMAMPMPNDFQKVVGTGYQNDGTFEPPYFKPMSQVNQQNNGQYSSANQLSENAFHLQSNFPNYEATADYNPWKNTQPPPPPLSWWGVVGKDRPEVEGYQNWANPPVTPIRMPEDNYYQKPMADKQYCTEETPRSCEMDSKMNNTNTYSLFSGNSWGNPVQAAKVAQDQPKPRLTQQSLWSGPGPSPLERLLEQQKSLREGGT